MEKSSSERTGIRIYTTPPHPDTPPPPSPPPPLLPHRPGQKMTRHRKRRPKKPLQNLPPRQLPTHWHSSHLRNGPPLNLRQRQMLPVTVHMIYALLGLCTLSCFFFHFTDSFRGPDGKLYYGFVTPRGLAVFKAGLVEVPKDDRFKVGLSDFVHAMLSALVFVAIAFLDFRVTGCVFHGHSKELDEVMQSFPLMVGIICNGLFLVFPTTRYGIGCVSA